MAGAPSQLELFEHKPELTKRDGAGLPRLIPGWQALCFYQRRAQAARLAISVSSGRRKRSLDCPTACRIWKNTLMISAFIKSMRTDQFNHAPAQLLVQTGNARLGYPSLGSWVLYGLGTENQNLPGFIVLISGGKSPDGGKQLWGSGFLPSVYQGVQCRSHGEPVLYLENPQGVSRSLRRSSSILLTKLIGRPMPRSAIRKPSPALRSTRWRSACKWTRPTPWTFTKNRRPC